MPILEAKANSIPSTYPAFLSYVFATFHLLLISAPIIRTQYVHMPPLPRTYDNVLTAGDLPPPSSSPTPSSCSSTSSRTARGRRAKQMPMASPSSPTPSLEDDGSCADHDVPLDDDSRNSYGAAAQTPPRGNFRHDAAGTGTTGTTADDLQSPVDSVLDPHAIDFQPLLTSLNGAAMTPSIAGTDNNYNNNKRNDGASAFSEYEQFGPHAHEMDGNGFFSGAYNNGTDRDRGLIVGFICSCLRGIKLLVGDVLSICRLDTYFNSFLSFLGTYINSLSSSLDMGQRVVFAAGYLRMMISRGLGAMQRYGKHYGNKLMDSVSQGINAVGVSGSGSGRGGNNNSDGMRERIMGLLSALPSLVGRDAKIALILICSVVAMGIVGKLNTHFSSPSSNDVKLSTHSDAEKLLSNIDLSVANPSNVRLPRPYEAMANVADRPLAITDTPVYWEIPRSGSTTMMNIAATCFAKVVASEVGELDGHATDATLQIVAKEYGNFVNVDTTRPNGIKRAQKLGLVQSRIAGAIFSPYAQEISSLFDHKHKGRFFTMMRDPVSRIVSMYYYNQVQGLLPSDDTTIVQFVAMNEENWMTRMLTNKMTGKIGAADLDVAKEVLRRKFVIGLWEDKTESMRRIEQYFGWKFPSPVAQNCKNDKLYFEWNNKNPHPSFENEDELILQIQKMNRFDVELYAYAKQLYREQDNMFWAGSVVGGMDGSGLR